MERHLALVISLLAVLTTMPSCTMAQHNDPNLLDVCFLCDVSCNNVLTARWGQAGVDLYLNQTVNGVAQLLSSLHPDLKSRMLVVSEMNLDLELAWFNGFDTSSNALANANMGLWGDATGLFDQAYGAGCDIGIAVLPSDNAFLYSAIEGIANMFQVCGELSFSVIKLYPDDFYHQVVLTAHEIGHLLGIYHDGPMNPIYEPFSALYPEEVEKMREACASENNGCTDAAGRCVMNPVPSGGPSMPTTFSSCSRNYFKMFKLLARDYPMVYDTTCFMQDATSGNAAP